MSKSAWLNIKMWIQGCALCFTISPLFLLGSDYHWSEDCGSMLWLETCETGSLCTGALTEYTNNWGLIACDASPPFPGLIDDVYMDIGNVILDGNSSISNLFILSSGSLQVVGGLGSLSLSTSFLIENKMEIMDGALVSLMNVTGTNNGSLNLYSSGTGIPGNIDILGFLAISGTGLMHLSEGASVQGSGTLRNQPGHTLTAGDSYISCLLENNGLIRADVNGETLQLIGFQKNNNALITATNGSMINISSDILQNVNGILKADGGSIIIVPPVNIIGGTLQTTGNSPIELSGSGNIGFDQVTTHGLVQVLGGIKLFINSGSMVNNGRIILIDEGTTKGMMGLPSDLNLSGNGSIELRGGLIDTPLTPHTIVQGTEHAIWGYGAISVDLINNGRLQASGVGQILALSSSTYDVENRGLMIIDSGATLALDSIFGFTNVNGTITVNGFFTFPTTFTMSSGTLRGTGQINGSIDQTIGATLPGDGNIGTLSIAGNFTQAPDTVLFIEVAGPGLVDTDHLQISGTAILECDLKVIPINGYIPQPGDNYTIVTAGSVPVQTMNLINKRDMELVFTSTEIEVLVNNSPPSPDINGDGIVNMLDLVEQAIPAIIEAGPVDMDGDAEVTLDDLLILVGNWRETINSP